MSRLYKDLIEALHEALAYEQGQLTGKGVKAYRTHVPEEIDVRAIRTKLGMTQEEFSWFGFSVSAIRHWENHRRQPEGAARVLLKLIDKDPLYVLGALKNPPENRDNTSH